MTQASNLDLTVYGVNIANANQNNYILGNFRTSLPYPLLDEAQDFYCAVTRFSIPSSELPTFTFQKDISQTNPNVGVYSCTLTYLGFDATSQVTYIPGDSTLQPPQDAFIVGRIPFDRYYWVYSVQSTIDMFNNALAASLAALKAHFPLDVALNAARNAYLLFSNGQLSLIVPQEWLTLPITMFVNYHWYILMSGLEGQIQAALSSPKYFNVALEVRDNLYLPPNTAGPATQYQYVIEFVNWSLWINIRQLAIFSQSLSTSGEMGPSLNQLGDQDAQSTITPLLADFNIDTNVNNEARGRVTFTQTGPWKILNILNRGALTNIDMQIFWVSNLGQRMIIRIGPNDAAQVKLLFIRKAVYSHMTAGEKNSRYMA